MAPVAPAAPPPAPIYDPTRHDPLADVTPDRRRAYFGLARNVDEQMGGQGPVPTPPLTFPGTPEQWVASVMWARNARQANMPIEETYYTTVNQNRAITGDGSARAQARQQTSMTAGTTATGAPSPEMAGFITTEAEHQAAMQRANAQYDRDKPLSDEEARRLIAESRELEEARDRYEREQRPGRIAGGDETERAMARQQTPMRSPELTPEQQAAQRQAQVAAGQRADVAGQAEYEAATEREQAAVAVRDLRAQGLGPGDPRFDAAYQRWQEASTAYESAEATTAQASAEANRRPLASLSGLAMLGFEALDKPRQAVVANMGEDAYRYVTTGEQGSMEGLLPDTEWQRWYKDPENAQAIQAAYVQGLNGFTGPRAVWELFIGEKPVAARAVWDVATDPLLVVEGAGAAARGARAAANVLDQGSRFGRVAGAGLRGAATGAEAIETVVNRVPEAAARRGLDVLGAAARNTPVVRRGVQLSERAVQELQGAETRDALNIAVEAGALPPPPATGQQQFPTTPVTNPPNGPVPTRLQPTPPSPTTPGVPMPASPTVQIGQQAGILGAQGQPVQVQRLPNQPRPPAGATPILVDPQGRPITTPVSAALPAQPRPPVTVAVPPVSRAENLAPPENVIAPGPQSGDLPATPRELPRPAAPTPPVSRAENLVPPPTRETYEDLYRRYGRLAPSTDTEPIVDATTGQVTRRVRFVNAAMAQGQRDPEGWQRFYPTWEASAQRRLDNDQYVSLIREGAEVAGRARNYPAQRAYTEQADVLDMMYDIGHQLDTLDAYVDAYPDVPMPDRPDPRDRRLGADSTPVWMHRAALGSDETSARAFRVLEARATTPVGRDALEAARTARERFLGIRERVDARSPSQTTLQAAQTAIRPDAGMPGPVARPEPTAAPEPVVPEPTNTPRTGDGRHATRATSDPAGHPSRPAADVRPGAIEHRGSPAAERALAADPRTPSRRHPGSAATGGDEPGADGNGSGTARTGGRATGSGHSSPTGHHGESAIIPKRYHRADRDGPCQVPAARGP
jgi:hypothetical protein